ncbi:Serine/threonine protein kinase 2 isoform 1 [Dorcoceras hygrometricum]|uniref:Serine/threonine protein kinase 2 isoform 1 n=1 Tax=Dorcoceras hygrometricum TaxID=472368 RepID=A0A2Z7AYD9_9LAMI|nr:Serine/threonine protein kinase 2 isoform 1 [Dorcoceras hygrometricum]
MSRGVQKMKRRRAEESPDGLALMTSSVTSSYSADGLVMMSSVTSSCSAGRRIQSQVTVSTSLKRNQQVATVLPGVSYNEPAVATHPVVGKSSRELQCYCISSRLGTQTQEKKKQAKCRDSTSRELQYPVVGNPCAKNPVAVMNQQRSS